MRKLFCKLGCASVALLIVIGGCINLERSYPDKHYFVLEVGALNAAPADRLRTGILEVSEIRVSPRYAEPNFVYRLSETGYESDFYNQFLIAPAAILTEETRKALAQSGVFEHVVSSSNQLPSNYRLQGNATALYGDFRNGAAPSAVVEVEFFLTRQASAPSEIVLAKRYSKSIPLSGRSPEALVKGWDEALATVLMSFLADVRAANLQPASANSR
jgi:ABC-type uncharacterized transport system auxiliary subunit